MDNPLFINCIKNIPNEYVRADNFPETTTTEIERRLFQAYLRWNDSCCNTCWKKGPNANLLICKCCGLVMYCSTECQAKEWKRHREYIKHLPETPIAWVNDPFRPAIVDLGEDYQGGNCSFQI